MGEPDNTQVANNNDVDTQENNASTDVETTEKTFTQDEVNNMISDRLKREQSKTAKLIEQAKQEALEVFKKEQEEEKQLSKLSENERLQKRLEKLEKENADLLATQQLAMMTTQARQELAKDGYVVDDAVLGLIVSKDEETTLNNMNALKAYTDGLKEKWEAERAKGVTPKANHNTGQTVVSREQFDRMTYAEKAHLQQTNPQLFNKLTGVE